ncbi:hypothetical protein [Bartonella alsatica]|nr:hypothetical protein [Bartonella alsatica]
MVGAGRILNIIHYNKQAEYTGAKFIVNPGLSIN